MIALLFLAFSASGLQLTGDNFKQEIIDSKKNSFIKFYAPWCGHCKNVKPHWDKLIEEFDGGKIIIGDVDCTAETKLCEEYKIAGYPSLRYFVNGSDKPEDYQGARDYPDLKKFILENIMPQCDVESREGCSHREKEYIVKFEAKTKEERQKELDRLLG